MSSPNVADGPSVPTTEIKQEDGPTSNPAKTPTAGVAADSPSRATQTPTVTPSLVTASNPNPTSIPSTITLTKKDYEAMTKIVKYLTEYKNEDDEEIAGAFQRIVDKRNYPDYWEIIKEPIAFSTIRAKITKKQYKGWKEFVRDFARIWHNAQVYNRPSAGVYQVAVSLRELFKAELGKLVDGQIINTEDAELPYLGELPELEPSPPPGPDDEEAEGEEEEEEDDEDEEEDESDDDRPRKGRKKGRRSSASGKRDGKAEDVAKDDPETQKKRGRPPKVHTPMEARINSLLKGLRKPKSSKGVLKITHFDRMIDKTANPDYYQEIKNPIAMDIIKRKAKRKKYQSVDQVLKDLELMFENAKQYNKDDSDVFKDAVDLQREARLLAEQEKKKPDSEFVDEDGRLPLAEILYEGEVWKVGDWVHLSNANDVTKPIVAQVYRTWQDPEGQKWINACWYYRPEQTVHRYEKHFFENEVVKTGQYRDHRIEEVVDRCFVMFFTRYHKGRPRGFPADKEVYVCEARYNEEKFKLNKIKTWASCVPDEVREKDYEMDLFDAPRKMKKVPSPIKHLLREDAKENDPLPKPTWGQPNAPPIVGAVHRRPREANESPPPEPTPSPQPTPEPVQRPVTTDRPKYESQNDVAMSGTTASGPLPSPSPAPAPSQTSYNQQFASVRPSASPAPPLQHSSYNAQGTSSAIAQPNSFPSQASYTPYTSSSTPVPQHQTPHSNYQYQQQQNVARPAVATTSSHGSHTNIYNPPRPVEVYTLPEVANSAIPSDIRAQFHCDEFGKIIFFTGPPIDINPVLDGNRGGCHSLRYLAEKARQKADAEKKRKDGGDQSASEPVGSSKRPRMDDSGSANKMVEQHLDTISKWTDLLISSTNDLYTTLYGKEWKEILEGDSARRAIERLQVSSSYSNTANLQNARASERSVKVSGFRWV